MVLILGSIIGIPVDLILCDDKANFSGNNPLNFQDFINKGGEIRISNFPKLMHHKFCIIDDRLLITGSYNWTNKAEYINFENVILSNDMELINEFIRQFENLKNETFPITNVIKTEFNDYPESIGVDSPKPPPPEPTEPPGGTLGVDTNDPIWDLYDEANVFYFKKDYGRALQLANDIINQSPNFSNIYSLISQIKYRQEKFPEQIEYANKALELDNKNFGAYLMLGLAYSNSKPRYQDAIKNFNICIAEYPDDYIYYWNKANICDLLGEDVELPENISSDYQKKADENFRMTIELADKELNNHPNDYLALRCSGEARILLNDKRKGKNDLRKALKVYQDCPENEQDIHILEDIEFLLANY